MPFFRERSTFAQFCAGIFFRQVPSTRFKPPGEVLMNPGSQLIYQLNKRATMADALRSSTLTLEINRGVTKTKNPVLKRYMPVILPPTILKLHYLLIALLKGICEWA